MKPRIRVLYRVENSKLIVEPIPSLEEVLREPKQVKISIEDFHRFRKELSGRLEG